MSAIASPFLRKVLALDAVASGATGVLLAFGAGPLSGLLGLSPMLMRPAGLFLAPYALLVAWMASRQSLPRGAVWAVVIANAVWVIESVILIAAGWVQPTLLGALFICAQAAVVATFGLLQFAALRHNRSVAAI
ncbi:hypothetical protein [Caulobacter sp. NIBR2454]|uniref:hypothetical protein n=1 Tax=Caulobacter sp. NIBR2454 TaxID=3015996 RepID=UPI0022B615DA|nr:hypothetical protein [Caulobacter sp. NIBR2454]